MILAMYAEAEFAKGMIERRREIGMATTTTTTDALNALNALREAKVQIAAVEKAIEAAAEKALEEGERPKRSIREISEEIYEWRFGHGFYTPESLSSEKERDMMLGKLGLVVSEVAEAMEAVRMIAPDHFASANRYREFSEELADVVIRVFDIAFSMKVDLEAEIEKKMAANRARPHRHGKACSL